MSTDSQQFDLYFPIPLPILSGAAPNFGTRNIYCPNPHSPITTHHNNNNYHHLPQSNTTWTTNHERPARTTQAKQYIREMAELTKRIKAAHGHPGGLNQYHQQQAQTERYNQISSSVDDQHLPKPLSVVVNPYFVFLPHHIWRSLINRVNLNLSLWRRRPTWLRKLNVLGLVWMRRVWLGCSILYAIATLTPKFDYICKGNLRSESDLVWMWSCVWPWWDTASAARTNHSIFKHIIANNVLSPMAVLTPLTHLYTQKDRDRMMNIEIFQTLGNAKKQNTNHSMAR